MTQYPAFSNYILSCQPEQILLNSVTVKASTDTILVQMAKLLYRMTQCHNARAITCHRVVEKNCRLKCDGTRAETRFRLSAKRKSPFKSAGASVRSTTGSRGVRISGSNAGHTMFRGSVKSIGYPLHLPVFPFNSPPLRRRVPSRLNCTLP